MKPHFEQICATDNHSFLCRSFTLHHFDSKYHFHPEYELTYIRKSSGKRYIGQHMGSFQQGDLVLVGKHLPHCWLNEAGLPDNHEASSIVIQFREDFLGEGWLAAPEFHLIAQMLRFSERGILFSQETACHIAPRLYELVDLPPFERVMQFLQILQSLASLSGNTLLNSQQNIRLSEEDCNRIQGVFEFVRLHFKEEIRLEEMASRMYMTPTSFCRYFKKITKKNFSRFLIEYRIEHARWQLLHTDRNITAICFESGFRNIAHFNQQFRILNNLSPREYRKQFTDLHRYA